MMCICRLVYTVYVFSNSKISHIFNIIRLSINVVMSTFTMVTETMEVLKPQI
jgi:hypothetical protein